MIVRSVRLRRAPDEHGAPPNVWSRHVVGKLVDVDGTHRDVPGVLHLQHDPTAPAFRTWLAGVRLRLAGRDVCGRAAAFLTFQAHASNAEDVFDLVLRMAMCSGVVVHESRGRRAG